MRTKDTGCKQGRGREYRLYYDSFIGRLTLTSGEEGLTSLSFEKERYPVGRKDLIDCNPGEGEALPFPLREAVRWLDVYFSGKKPDFTPPLAPEGTEFRRLVWKHLLRIPYGTAVTYGEIAEAIAKERGISRMSAQAVGGAVGHNPIGILIPCHRVLGADGSLTGFGGGIRAKEALLRLEGMDMGNFYIPERGTAL